MLPPDKSATFVDRLVCAVKPYLPFTLLVVWLALAAPAVAQTARRSPIPAPVGVIGRNDTIFSKVIVYQGDTIPERDLEWVFVSHRMPRAMRQRWEAMSRLRNAVYVTYPYARKAGFILNEMNQKLATMKSEGEKKDYIQSREKELKKEFSDPLENLSVYQGKILMKLINRQTGNNCYEIIKEYKGGFNARFYQTVAFFFGSSLRQPYDAKGEDQDIETIVRELERMYRG